MFVHPSQVAKVVAPHASIGKTRLVVTTCDNLDVMTLECETTDVGEQLKSTIKSSLKSITGLNGDVKFLAPGTLPNDGKVIDDQRPQS